jgi:membrane protein DedA with SNARE-associated domain
LVSPQKFICGMERLFGRCGVRVLIIARFVPGLSLVSVPLCGTMAVRWHLFVLHDCVGLGLWATAALAVGAMCAARIGRNVLLLGHFGWQALIAIAVALALVVACRRYRRVTLERAAKKSHIGASASNSLHVSDDELNSTSTSPQEEGAIAS